jgi:hypothetical protein
MKNDFITGFIQEGRNKPKKFRHYIKMPQSLFDEILEAKLIDIEYLAAEQIAFFQFSGEMATVNFMNLYQSEDFYAKVTNYLLVKLLGENPIQRGGVFE